MSRHRALLGSIRHAGLRRAWLQGADGAAWGCLQVGSEKALLLALLEDVQAKHAEVATMQAQQQLTLKAVAVAASERDAALRRIGPGNDRLAEARAVAESKPHQIRVRSETVPAPAAHCPGLVGAMAMVAWQS